MKKGRREEGGGGGDTGGIYGESQTPYNTLEEYVSFSVFVSHIIELVEGSLTLFCLLSLCPEKRGQTHLIELFFPCAP